MKYLTKAGIKFLEEAMTPERHGAIIANKALHRFDNERDAFEKSGGKVSPTNLPGFNRPSSKNFLKASEYDKAMDKEGEKGVTAEELRKKRLTTQLKLKDKVRKGWAASKGSGPRKMWAKRIDRMHSTQDKRGGDRPGWRGQDETDFAQQHGKPYPGGPDRFPTGKGKRMTTYLAPSRLPRHGL